MARSKGPAAPCPTCGGSGVLRTDVSGYRTCLTCVVQGVRWMLLSSDCLSELAGQQLAGQQLAGQQLAGQQLASRQLEVRGRERPGPSRPLHRGDLSAWSSGAR